MGCSKQIRVLVANQPVLMREAVTVLISNQPDIEIAGELADTRDLPEVVESLRPDVLVLNGQSEVARRYGGLLKQYPGMRILGIDAERNTSVMYWAAAEIRSKSVEHSGQGILNAIRERTNSSGERHPLAHELQ